ncbi:hypothetical protein CFIMG_007366RA00001 [Ceratocystis fimbriata CBS 114723]|uniref:Uncharacterized protein n=1 Tax=Ceratocystis fimbriata CBS 114723 TaxID=1035309 RepID=A0A2C5XFZ1_9PEZI|nr:hypothetical protein CFIMG_007366RA00001 [Ceratocystis fimbriata CBS 114723]
MKTVEEWLVGNTNQTMPNEENWNDGKETLKRYNTDTASKFLSRQSGLAEDRHHNSLSVA